MDWISDWMGMFRKKHEEKMANVVKPTILVCGYTGSGKTSLIQAICGKDTVPDDKIGHCESMTQEFTAYRNAFVDFWDSKGLEPGKREAEFIKNCKSLVAKLQEDRDARNHIHLVWYTIQGCGARVTDSDIELIQKVFSNVIVLITKNDLTRPDQRDLITAKLVAKGVKQDLVVPVSDNDPISLQALVDLSRRLLPEAYRDAFESAQQVDLSRKKVKAQAVILAAAASAAAVGLIPIPVTDALIITPIQFGMIASLAVLYGLTMEAVKVSVVPIVAQVAGVMTASSLTKVLPGIGSLIQAGVAGSLTEVIGQIVNVYMIKCCEARIKGQPMPEFVMPITEDLAQLLAKNKKGKQQS